MYMHTFYLDNTNKRLFCPLLWHIWLSNGILPADGKTILSKNVVLEISKYILFATLEYPHI